MPFHTEERIIEAKFGADGNKVTGTRQRERIVRCKDCANYRTNDGCADVCVIVFGDEFNVEPDGFCAWGERKE